MPASFSWPAGLAAALSCTAVAALSAWSGRLRPPGAQRERAGSRPAACGASAYRPSSRCTPASCLAGHTAGSSCTQTLQEEEVRQLSANGWWLRCCKGPVSAAKVRKTCSGTQAGHMQELSSPLRVQAAARLVHRLAGVRRGLRDRQREAWCSRAQPRVRVHE